MEFLNFRSYSRYEDEGGVWSSCCYEKYFSGDRKADDMFAT